MTPFLPLSFPPDFFILGKLNCHHPFWNSKGTSNPCGEEVFNWVISSDFLPLNDLSIPTLLYSSSTSHSFSDIFFASSSPAVSCLWEVLQNLASDHLPILLIIPLSLVFHLNERLPFFNFQKTCWDDFFFDSDSHCSSAKKFLSFSFSFATYLFSDTECGQIFHSFQPHQMPS